MHWNNHHGEITEVLIWRKEELREEGGRRGGDEKEQEGMEREEKSEGKNENTNFPQ